MTCLIDIQLIPGPVEYHPRGRFPGDAGAECVFLGRTRNEHHPEHGQLVELSYEAYPALAESALRKLAERAAEQFGCEAICIHHGTGIVPPGEASVMIQVITAHRAESFDACRFLIDRLKLEVPIWKREVWHDGSTWSAGSPVEIPEDKS